MDRKSIILLVACFALILCWEPMLHYIHPQWYQHPPTPTNAVPTAAAVPTPTSSVSVTNPMAGMVTHWTGQETMLSISNDNARYVFTSRGGGLKEVLLLNYPATVSSKRSKNKVTNEVATLNDWDLPAAFTIYGDDSLVGDGEFTLTKTAGGVHAEKTLPSGLSIVKDFEITTNYLMSISVRFENHSRQPLKVPPQTWMAGAATPMDPTDNGFAETVMSYNGSKSAAVDLRYFNTNTSTLGLFSRTPKTLFQTNDIAWVAAQNQFFTLATIPDKRGADLAVTMVDLPPASAEEIQANPATIRSPKALQAVLLYPALTIAAGQSVSNHFFLFAGPKKYETLAELAARFNNDIDIIMNFGWVSIISKALLVIMNWLHQTISLPYGWIIVGITLVLRICLWPMTAASVRSSKRMQALQPQLKALQEKYKDDPQKATAKQWEFYKKNKVNPMSGCLPAFVQLPIFGGFYYMLRGAIELRGAPFLWIGDLSKPDTIFSVPLHFMGVEYLPLNPMPLIMGATMLWGASMVPPSPTMDASQQKMMKYMPLIMLVFMYNLSSGLALYWTVSNIMTVLQNKITRAQPLPTDEAPKAAVSVAPQKKKKD